jgi:hypothetical protein
MDGRRSVLCLLSLMLRTFEVGLNWEEESAGVQGPDLWGDARW